MKFLMKKLKGKKNFFLHLPVYLRKARWNLGFAQLQNFQILGSVVITEVGHSWKSL
jgi:hypothetical protein